MTTGTTDELPEDVRALFWDCAPGSVSWSEHRDFIARRVLSRGSWDSILWLRKRVGDAVLRDLLLRTGGRGLTRQQVRFWQAELDLPGSEVDAWLSDPIRQTWDHRQPAT